MHISDYEACFIDNHSNQFLNTAATVLGSSLGAFAPVSTHLICDWFLHPDTKKMNLSVLKNSPLGNILAKKGIDFQNSFSCIYINLVGMYVSKWLEINQVFSLQCCLYRHTDIL